MKQRQRPKLAYLAAESDPAACGVGEHLTPIAAADAAIAENGLIFSQRIGHRESILIRGYRERHDDPRDEEGNVCFEWEPGQPWYSHHPPADRIVRVTLTARVLRPKKEPQP